MFLQWKESILTPARHVNSAYITNCELLFDHRELVLFPLRVCLSWRSGGFLFVILLFTSGTEELQDLSIYLNCAVFFILPSQAVKTDSEPFFLIATAPGILVLKPAHVFFKIKQEIRKL